MWFTKLASASMNWQMYLAIAGVVNTYAVESRPSLVYVSRYESDDCHRTRHTNLFVMSMASSILVTA